MQKMNSHKQNPMIIISALFNVWGGYRFVCEETL